MWIAIAIAVIVTFAVSFMWFVDTIVVNDDEDNPKTSEADAQLIQKAYRVAKSCKTNEQIAISTKYLSLVKDRIKTSYGHWLFKVMLDEIAKTVK